MAVRYLCDRCGADVTCCERFSLAGCQAVDASGDGTITERFDHLCLECYTAVLEFIRTPGPPLRQQIRAALKSGYYEGFSTGVTAQSGACVDAAWGHSHVRHHHDYPEEAEGARPC